MTPLAERRILVVGGAGGIGSSVAAAVVRAGATVVVADRDAQGAAAVAAPLGGSALALDLADPAAAAAAAAALSGPLHGLVNAAGIAERDAAAATSADEWERLLRVNLVAPVLIAQAAAARMPVGGSIVNVTSIAGRSVLATSGQPTPAYAASKAGLEQATRALAVAAAERGVRVNSVAPGFVRTALTSDALDAVGDWIADRTPLGRLAEPVDVADAVLFLLGEEARFITGQALVVDGGLTLGLLRRGER